MAHPRAVPPSATRGRGVDGPDALPPATLVDLVRHLDASGPGDTPALICVVPGRAGPVVELDVVLDDPVDALIGRVAPADALAVGLRAPAHSHHLDGRRPPTAGRVLHLVNVRGTSVTLLPGTRPAGPVVGPTDAPLIGRVPEACRRQLGLPTPPPPPIAVTTVVDLWLTRLTVAAIRGDAVRWSDALALLAAAPGPITTPSDAATALHRTSRGWSWERIREGVARGSTELVAGCVDPVAAAWMDAGMFARWVASELPPTEVLLDALDATTSPAVVDRIRAALPAAGGTGHP